MNKKLKVISTIMSITLFTGCVPAPSPNIGTSIGGADRGIGAGYHITSSEYGERPQHYVLAIKNYFSTKLPHSKDAIYKFGEPKRAYKKRGLAYGGEVEWKGWLVETSVATRSRTGRLLTPKPYMVLFKGNQIVEHILGNSHKLVVKVDK